MWDTVMNFFLGDPVNTPWNTQIGAAIYYSARVLIGIILFDYILDLLKVTKYFK